MPVQQVSAQMAYGNGTSIPVGVAKLDHLNFLSQLLDHVLVVGVGLVKRLQLGHQVLIHPRKISLGNFQNY